MFRLKMQCHDRLRLVCFHSKCSATGGLDRCVQAQTVVPREAQTSMFRLKMFRHGRPRSVCLNSKCSATGGPDQYVKAQNKVPQEAQTNLLRLKVQCHERPRPREVSTGMFTLKRQCQERPRQICLGSKKVAQQAQTGVKSQNVMPREDLDQYIQAQKVVPRETQTNMFRVRMQCQERPRTIC